MQAIRYLENNLKVNFQFELFHMHNKNTQNYLKIWEIHMENIEI